MGVTANDKTTNAMKTVAGKLIACLLLLSSCSKDATVKPEAQEPEMRSRTTLSSESSYFYY